MEEVLRSVGIGLEGSRDRPSVRSECARLASIVRARGVRTLGLLPASDDVAVPALALALARALSETSLRPVGVVDPQGSWPGASALREAAEGGGAPVTTTWIAERLALLSPPVRDRSGALAVLKALVADETAGFGHLVVDLTGLDHLGEHLTAVDLLDAVALVARSGRTTTRQASARLRELPERSTLGVLLTGL